jgi:rod shape-determining protein MreB
MFGNVYGLDLGTYEIKVYDKKKDTVWKEKNAIAIADESDLEIISDDDNYRIKVICGVAQITEIL